LGDDALEELLVLRRLAHADADVDLQEPRTLVRIPQIEDFAELGGRVGHVVVFQFRHPVCHVVHRARGTGIPTLTAIRSLVLSSSTWIRTRLGSPVVGSMSITFDTWIGASKVMIPPSGLAWLGRVCRLRWFTPSTRTRPSSRSTSRTVPSRSR